MNETSGFANAATPTQSGTLTSQPPITKPATIQMPYGTTVLQPGMKLPVISRDASAVRVRYMNDVYTIPSSSTNSK